MLFLIGLALNDYDLDREEIQASYQVLQPQYNFSTPGQLVIPGSENISHWNLQLNMYTVFILPKTKS